MSVKAKFKCDSITNYAFGGKEVSLSAVYGSTEENKDFSNATPSGQLKIGISGDVPASQFFTPGKEYYLTFDEAPAG